MKAIHKMTNYKKIREKDTNTEEKTVTQAGAERMASRRTSANTQHTHTHTHTQVRMTETTRNKESH